MDLLLFESSYFEHQLRSRFCNVFIDEDLVSDIAAEVIFFQCKLMALLNVLFSMLLASASVHEHQLMANFGFCLYLCCVSPVGTSWVAVTSLDVLVRCPFSHGLYLSSGVGLCDREGRDVSDHRVGRHGAESVEHVLQSTGMSRFCCLVDGNLKVQIMSDLASFTCLNLLKAIKCVYSILNILSMAPKIKLIVVFTLTLEQFLWNECDVSIC